MGEVAMTDTLHAIVETQNVPELRPRERILVGGASALDAADLVAVVLGTGTVGCPAETLARELVARVEGLRGLAARTAVELAALDGVGEARAARILAALELGRRVAAEPLLRGAAIRDGATVFRHCHAAMRELRVEQFRALLLDGKQRLLREELISQGTLTSSPVHPREVFAPAIRHSAAAVVLVHNHPSGDPTPSSDDLDITNRLADVGRLVGIRVMDHVIIGDGAYASFADRGLMSR
jgi:DNA repair protein RadC